MQIKRVFNKLDDSFVVRKCISPSLWTPDFFLHQNKQSWLAICVCDSSFQDLNPDQLFNSDAMTSFEALLLNLKQLNSLSPQWTKGAKLIIMWGCTPEQTQRLSDHHELRQKGIRITSKETFLEQGETYLPKLAIALDTITNQELFSHFFPEVEIPALCTTRRQLKRDNSAKAVQFFLDTQQEWASKLDLDLPKEQSEAAEDCSIRLINGVAGSGKTLIAISRALMLSRANPKHQVLILIHNKPVVADLNQRLKQIYGVVPKNLRIMTAFAWIREQWVAQNNVQPSMPSNHLVLELIAETRKTWPDIKIEDKQLQDEFDFINDALIIDQNQYLEADRAGQGFALRAAERSQIWELYETVVLVLERRNMRLWSSLPRDIVSTENTGAIKLYRHILIDEAQFFAPSWFQVVKRCLEHSDSSLFLCADPNQGFLKGRLSWKRVGLDVAGKTKKLRKSYRTTQKILEAANQVLVEFTDADAEDFLTPDFEGMDSGEPPVLIISASPQDAITQLCNEIKAHTETLNTPLSNILLVYGKGISEPMLTKKLGQTVGEQYLWNLSTDQVPPKNRSEGHLRIARLDTATGLEAHVVFLIGLESLISRGLSSTLSNSGKTKDLEQSARKLYMAMTRAGHRLILINSESVPEKFASLFSQIQPTY